MANITFVAGAGGFVGRALVDALVQRGDEVRGLDVRFPPAWPPQAAQLTGDICDAGLLHQGCDGATYVVHLAALLPQRHACPAEMRRVNVDGTRALVEAALQAGVRRLVMVSSAEVYGLPRAAPCPEDAPLRPLGEYGRNKVEAERLVRVAGERGLEVVILRPPTIVGPRMPERLLAGMLAVLRRGRVLFVPGGGRRFQFVALSDVVAACLLAAVTDGGVGETFNIGSEDVPSQLETFRRLRDRVGSRSAVIPVPPALLRVVGRALLAAGRSPIEPEHLPIALGDYVFDIRKAREQLGWRPAKGNVEALADAYEWLAASPDQGESAARA